MELNLSIDSFKPEREILTLKSFIDREDIDGIAQNEIDSGEHIKGTQGVAILSSITIILKAAEKPLIELIDCLKRYVDSYDSKVIIKNSNGASIEIDKKRGIDSKTLKELAQMFLTQST